MRGSGSIRSLKQGTENFIGILSSYDVFGATRQSLTTVTNLMLATSLATLAWVVLSYPPPLDPSDVSRARTVLLLIFFFGFSAMLFAFFRAILFLIHGLMELAVAPVNGLAPRIAATRKKDNLKGALDSVLGTLNTSFAIWWKARKMIIAGIFLVIPAIVFYLLGVALLVMFIIRTLLAGV
ncbi:MAG: hypothetical protein LUQ40_04450 [Methanomicrobiales archaeon]|nr:hypothetical protein [Methanomicrobiales archaeon]